MPKVQGRYTTLDKVLIWGGYKIMRIINASYEIITPISDGGLEELKKIEKIARTCYKSERLIKEDGESAKRLVSTLIKNGHEAMLEHGSLTIKFFVDRGISHEIVRHRIASYAQESTRYCNYTNKKFENEISYISIIDGMLEDKKMSALSDNTIIMIYGVWEKAIEVSEAAYLKMIELGATPQIARSVLPNSLKTELVMTANYREWRNFFKLRTANSAHPQMREVIIPLLKELKRKLPIIFDDIEV